jgi:hypothetical protein
LCDQPSLQYVCEYPEVEVVVTFLPRSDGRVPLDSGLGDDYVLELGFVS